MFVCFSALRVHGITYISKEIGVRSVPTLPTSSLDSAEDFLTLRGIVKGRRLVI